MASMERLQERIGAMARELAIEELGEVDDSNSLSWLDAVESRAVEIGNMIAAELIRQKTEQRPMQPDESVCPECGQQARYEGRRERRLQARCGPTTVMEPEYYCPACRRDFFPDGPRNRR